ncbi:MAG: glycosyltransferase family A protein [Patescibacteria group bacterium]|nr:glycosyltransferase family A protein [Patescibacteria group bacterium]
MPKLISIIIPVYNRVEIFEKSLLSATQQNYENKEIIVVDDGSVEGNVERGMRNVKKNTNVNIIYYRQENKGAPAARNKGFDLSKGEYVIFWDADIEAESDMLEKMAKKLDKKQDLSFVYSSFNLGKKKMLAKKFSPIELQKNNYIHTSSLIRREDFPLFDEKLKRFQDWDLWLTMLELGKKGEWIDEYLFTIISTGIISGWLPKFAYKKPCKNLPWWSEKVSNYEKAKKIIVEKHHLDDFQK